MFPYGKISKLFICIVFLINISGDSTSYFLEMIMLISSVGNKTQTNIIHILVRRALGLNVSSFFAIFSIPGTLPKGRPIGPSWAFY